MLDIDVINKVEVIIEVSLITTKDFYDKSGEASDERVINID